MQNSDGDDSTGKKSQKRSKSDSKHTCEKCGKILSNAYSYRRHKKTCDKQQIRKAKLTTCKFCRQSFTSYLKRYRHEKKCKDNPETSGNNNSTGANEPIPSTSRDQSQRQLTCRRCKCKFSPSELYNHRMLHHLQDDNHSYQSPPWTNENDLPPWRNDDDGTINDELQRVYIQHKHLILKQKRTDLTTMSRYNFPVSNALSMEQLRDQVEEIYDNHNFSFKINLSIGIILRHVNTGRYRYFAPYSNENVFENPILISNRDDLAVFLDRLSEMDVLNYVMLQRPGSSWKPVMICNIVFSVYRTSFPLGNTKRLPNYIKKNKSIISLDTDPRTGKVYDDDLCMFRCLAFHTQRDVRSIKQLTKHHYSKWLEYVEENKLRSSEVNITSFPHIELCFGVNLNVYSLQKHKTTLQTYKSMNKFSDQTLNLNLHDSHLSYITNFKKYASKFRCYLCDMMFPNNFRLNRHTKSCQKATKIKLPGGYYKRKKSIFEKLEEFNINVEAEKRHFPWFAVFDLESILVPVESQSSDANRQLNHSHKPVCVCICSNVPDFEKEVFILNENTDSLLDEMCTYLKRISEKCSKLANSRWADVFQSLDLLREKYCADYNTEETLLETDAFCSNDCDDNDDDDGIQAMETDYCEPPSAEFIRTMSKENVWHRYLNNLEKSNGVVQPKYNDWDMDCDSSDSSTTSVDSDPTMSSTVDANSECNGDDDDYDDDAEEEGNIQSFRPLNTSSPIVSDDDDNDDDDDDDGGDGDNSDDNIQPFRALNSRRIDDDDDDDDDIQCSNSPLDVLNEMKKKLLKIRSDFEFYTAQIPVIGFNSGKYDLQLIKAQLVARLELHKSKGRKFIIKKNNNYVCISNSHFKFLDLVNFLPPKTSYDAFLVTFNAPVRKSFFPYEYMTDISKLNDTCLPPKEAFYSNLKKCNTLENKMYLKYQAILLETEKTEEEILENLGLKEVPLSSIQSTYDKLKHIWEEKQMTTMADFLQHYAELDVGPMVQGIINFQQFFFDRNIDVFKDYVSVPGIARKMLYDCGLKNGASFSLFDKLDEDLYETFMANMTGGPSIVFKRRHKVGETFLRKNENRPCQSIYGYDANSLYLYAIGREMPVGRYIRRRRLNSFKPDNRVKRYFAMYDWMDWVSHTSRKLIRHKMNDGQEFKVGPYYVDGKSDTDDEVFEFLGCYWHGCESCMSFIDQKQEEKYHKTMRRIRFIESQGFKVTYIWECQYRQQLRENDTMKEFITKSNSMPLFYRNHPKEVTTEQILEATMSEELFGFIEVDIQIPDCWDQVKYQPETTLSPYQYFQEMSPLFVTSEIPYECIGSHMKDHIEKHNLSKKPRTLLVGGLRAQNMLVMTPLLKWYISQGMLVTKIHQVIEYSKQRCFENFVNEVANARRAGSCDESKKVFASMFKLIGCSAFGGTIINKEKQKRYKFAKGFKDVAMMVNNPRFQSVNEFDNEIAEVEFKKARIEIDNPVTLGIAILNYAKLHLLRFHFEFLDKFVDRSDYELLECDTDSLYFALSKPNLEEAIKEDLKHEFNRNQLNRCSDTCEMEPGVDNLWFPRTCCEKHKKYDLYTPGLYKTEFSGTSMTALCSKSYVVKSDKDVKYSLKGVNKDFYDPTAQFEQVLSNQSALNSTNRGIALHENTLYSYTQQKNAFTYLYIKREVCHDRISTKPLNLILKPVKRKQTNDK